MANKGDRELAGDGLRSEGAGLHTETVPPPPGVRRLGRMVLVHGFTQTGRSWARIAGLVSAAGYEVVLVDAPGHGGSSQVRADLWSGAELLGRAGGRAAYVGYSMGARLCLHLALARPELVSRLVLLGATAGIEDPGERAARRQADEARAAGLDPRLPGPGAGTGAEAAPPAGTGTGTEGVASSPMAAGGEERRRLDDFLGSWLAQPLFATLPPASAGLADRRRNTAAGLAASLRLAGTGAQGPLWDRLRGLAVPTLVLAGSGDAKFSALGRRLAAAIGANAELSLLDGAGHAAHLEQPDAFTAALLAFVGEGGGSTERDLARKPPAK